jgi:mono/diheme cytochrome c family protein
MSVGPAAAFLALVFVAGCATSRRAPRAPAPVEATIDAGAPVVTDVHAPALARVPVASPAPPRDPQADVGSAVFMSVCGPCHLGMWRVPSGGSLSATERPEAAVRRQIREGSRRRSPGAMPAIGVDRLPESDMPALMAYLRSTRVVAPR